MTPKELQDLHARLAHMEQQRRHDQGTLQRSARRARLSWACALAVLAFGLVVNLRPAALAQSPGTSLASLVAAITALQNTTATQSNQISTLQSQEKYDISVLQSQQKKDETQEERH